MDRTSIVNEWLEFANKDISSAKYLLNMRPVPLEIICYHCEQAAEKALKGYLIKHDIEPPRTHDLRLLCKMCANIDNTFDDISKYCVNLTAYGVLVLLGNICIDLCLSTLCNRYSFLVDIPRVAIP